MGSLVEFGYKDWFAALSVIFSSIAYFPCVVATWKVNGKNDVFPTVSGWLSWVAADVVILAAMIANDTIAWQMVPYLLGSTLVVILSLRKGILLARLRNEEVSWRSAFADWNNKDTICVALVVIGILAWIIKHNLDYAVYLSIFAAFVGVWAIAQHLIRDPYREDILTWLLFFTGGVCGVIAIKVWDVAGALAPFAFLTVQSVLLALCARRFLVRRAI